MNAASGEQEPLLFLIAGEPSGDALGADLMSALKELSGNKIRFAGIGGAGMSAQGLQSLFPMADLSVMGIVEVLPRLPKLMRRIDETVEAIIKLRPAAVVTIDAPSFCFRVAARLKKAARRGGPKIPVIHYVAPQVWAWRSGRARKLAHIVDHLLVLLPFEPPYFEKYGLACTYVGHPAISGEIAHDGGGFRAKHGMGENETVLCLLPGSRRSEVSRLLPIYRKTVERLAGVMPKLRCVAIVADAVADEVGTVLQSWPVPVIQVRGTERFAAMAASTVALAASGTVTLELAKAGTPMVVAYRMNWFSAWLARRLVHVQYVTLVNLVLGRGVIPELLLEDCYPEALASALLLLLRDSSTRDAQRSAMKEALQRLGQGGPRPGHQAARAVLKVIGMQGSNDETQSAQTQSAT